ncbi:ArgS-related anticodon-binding protein NrtL [Streptomyces sp. NPDC008313]|uniref:ArgS-related anticodon-binding protein NrtL n=1 Tax=Streptomyces sp. NPDC008313 TaxID=3364826 RepID=UPI0036E7C79E
MTPVELSRTVLRAVRCAVEAGELSVAVPERVAVTVPGPGGWGDYATNVALQLARDARRTPRDVAEIVRAHLNEQDGVAGVEITGPGFINVRVEAGVRDLVAEIAGGEYGLGDALAGETVVLRITDGDVRAQVVADSLVRIVATQGGRADITPVPGPVPVTVPVSGGSAAPAPAPHSRPTTHVTLRPHPAPRDPAPLGPDAARWALLHPAGHDRPRVGGDVLVQRESNPLFRVRYAHARVRALLRNAADLGFGPVPGEVSGAGEPPSEVPGTGALVGALAGYPVALRAAAVQRAPDRLARHLVAVADALLGFQHTVLPLGDEKPSAAHRSRLALAEAAGTVLAGGLTLLGIDAPEHI